MIRKSDKEVQEETNNMVKKILDGVPWYVYWKIAIQMDCQHYWYKFTKWIKEIKNGR